MQEFLENEDCFKENWMSVSKLKHAGVSDPNKQKNNMQYQIYYYIILNITRTKTI